MKKVGVARQWRPSVTTLIIVLGGIWLSAIFKGDTDTINTTATRVVLNSLMWRFAPAIVRMVPPIWVRRVSILSFTIMFVIDSAIQMGVGSGLAIRSNGSPSRVLRAWWGLARPICWIWGISLLFVLDLVVFSKRTLIVMITKNFVDAQHNCFQMTKCSLRHLISAWCKKCTSGHRI